MSATRSTLYTNDRRPIASADFVSIEISPEPRGIYYLYPATESATFSAKVQSHCWSALRMLLFGRRREDLRYQLKRKGRPGWKHIKPGAR